MTNEITCSNVDVIELRSESDLTLETNTQIRFRTSNLMFDYIPFDEIIRHIVFGDGYSSTSHTNIHSGYGISHTTTTDLVDMSFANNGDIRLDHLDCQGISANDSFIADNKIHYINLAASNNIRLLQTTSNIIYEKLDDRTYSLSNYIYTVLNSTTSTEGNVPADSSTNSLRNVRNLGRIHTNRIISSNMSTKNINVDGTNEPIMLIESDTAINFKSDLVAAHNIVDSIYIGDMLLRNYVYQYLDETPRGAISKVFHFFVNIGNGADITMTYDSTQYGGFSNSLFGNKFNYEIVYKMYNEDVDPSILDTYLENTPNFPKSITDNNVQQGIHDTQSFVFDNLIAGNFYRIYADITNLKTHTTVKNVGPIETNIATIPVIDISSIIIQVLNETQIQFTFNPHQIQLSSTFSLIIFTMKLISPVQTSYVNDNDGYVNDNDGVNPTQDITTSAESSRSPRTFVFNVGNIESYYGKNYIDKDTQHEFNIKSATTSGFQMISDTITVNSELNVLSNRPVAPSSLTVSHHRNTTYQFTITPGTQTLFTAIQFAIESLTPFSNSLTPSHDFGEEIPAGNYYAVCKNVYDEQSDRSPKLNIQSFNVTGLSVSINNDRTRTVSFTVTGAYGNYTATLSGVGDDKSKTDTNEIISNEILVGDNKKFTIDVTDSLNRSRTVEETTTFNVVSPSGFSISALSYVPTTERIYRATISPGTYNGDSYSTTGLDSFSITGTGSSDINVDFEIPDFTNDGKITSSTITYNKTITDEYGYTTTVSKSTIITPNFSTTPPTISYSNDRVLIASSGFTSYSWSGNGASGTNSSSTVDNNPGTITCIVTETNDQGFTKDYTLQETIVLPTITNASFEITSSNEYTYDFTVNYNNGSPTPSLQTYTDNYHGTLIVKLDEVVVTDYTSSGIYQLYASQISDVYGFSISNVMLSSYTKQATILLGPTDPITQSPRLILHNKLIRRNSQYGSYIEYLSSITYKVRLSGYPLSLPTYIGIAVSGRFTYNYHIDFEYTQEMKDDEILEFEDTVDIVLNISKTIRIPSTLRLLGGIGTRDHVRSAALPDLQTTCIFRYPSNPRTPTFVNSLSEDEYQYRCGFSFRGDNGAPAEEPEFIIIFTSFNSSDEVSLDRIQTIDNLVKGNWGGNIKLVSADYGNHYRYEYFQPHTLANSAIYMRLEEGMLQNKYTDTLDYIQTTTDAPEQTVSALTDMSQIPSGTTGYVNMIKKYHIYGWFESGITTFTVT